MKLYETHATLYKAKTGPYFLLCVHLSKKFKIPESYLNEVFARLPFNGKKSTFKKIIAQESWTKKVKNTSHFTLCYGDAMSMCGEQYLC